MLAYIAVTSNTKHRVARHAALLSRDPSLHWHHICMHSLFSTLCTTIAVTALQVCLVPTGQQNKKAKQIALQLVQPYITSQ